MEAQHVLSTRKLVDSAEEQEILEELIDRTKPPRRDGGPDGLHYLLYTPFRYPPLRYGSRFGARHEPSPWYGSRELHTVFAESAYYRLLFLAGTTADLSPISVVVSAFRATVRTSRGIDLTRAPFDRFRETISSPVAYADSQQLGHDMRDDGVEVFRYESARDPRGGVNVALFTVRAFGALTPDSLQNWSCLATPDGVEFVRVDFLDRKRHRFARSDFEVDGRLPLPAP